MDANMMDRGTHALRAHMNGCSYMEIRQTRKGWLQECLGCEARTEFKFFIGGEQIAHSLEDSDCLCRICCAPIHPFTMVVKELNTDAELVTVERPVRCARGNCKCCCYQEATFSSGGNELGSITEQCTYCVSAFDIKDRTGRDVYVVQPPTCFGGMCVNYCAEGNPCGQGCCKKSFRIYTPGEPTDGDAPYLGTILKKPKSLAVELFTESNAFDLHFPKDATADQKGIIIGTSLFLNEVFFEGHDEG